MTWSFSGSGRTVDTALDAFCAAATSDAHIPAQVANDLKHASHHMAWHRKHREAASGLPADQLFTFGSSGHLNHDGTGHIGLSLSVSNAPTN